MEGQVQLIGDCPAPLPPRLWRGNDRIRQAIERDMGSGSRRNGLFVGNGKCDSSAPHRQSRSKKTLQFLVITTLPSEPLGKRKRAGIEVGRMLVGVENVDRPPSFPFTGTSRVVVSIG